MNMRAYQITRKVYRIFTPQASTRHWQIFWHNLSTHTLGPFHSISFPFYCKTLLFLLFFAKKKLYHAPDFHMPAPFIYLFILLRVSKCVLCSVCARFKWFSIGYILMDGILMKREAMTTDSWVRFRVHFTWQQVLRGSFLILWLF